MGKFLLFPLLWWIFGNPFVAIIVLLLLFYFIDRRFIGLSPSLIKPFRRRSRISKLRQQLLLNPNDLSAKQEISRLLIEQNKYREARKWLEPISDRMDHSAEYWDDLGTVLLHTGEPVKGEEAIRKALEINPRVKYGAPYLRLANIYADKDADQAIRLLDEFRSIHSSSCEAYYRLGDIYLRLGQMEQAGKAFEEAVQIYRSLPKYKKKEERRWALKSKLKRMRLT
ncbi:tetratricopeptide repeat protein [Paenibacillus tarimensis]